MKERLLYPAEAMQSRKLSDGHDGYLLGSDLGFLLVMILETSMSFISQRVRGTKCY